MSQLKQKWISLFHLDLLLDYGAQSWKQVNNILVGMQASVQVKLGEMNWSMMNQQTQMWG